MKNLRTIFGLHVGARRRALGLTQAQLAKKVKVSVNAIGQIERGQHAASFKTIGALSAALSVHPAELFGGRPLVLGKRRDPADKIAARLALATPAQLKKVAIVLDAVLD